MVPSFFIAPLTRSIGGRSTAGMYPFEVSLYYKVLNKYPSFYKKGVSNRSISV